jgi:4-amino-4-deoxychorismate lyase
MNYWYDGKLREGDTLALNINDPALLYGANVFTTLRVYQGSLDHPLTRWQCHCERLNISLQAFAWVPPNWERIRQGAEIILNHYPVLRIVIFPDGREWISGRYLPADLEQVQRQGTRGWVAGNELYQRSLAAYKTGNYLGAWLARQRAQDYSATEAILIDSQGNWLETATGNLWGWKDAQWWTPKLNGGILAGIGRSHLIKSLQEQNIPVAENQWNSEFIQDLEVIAYSNSVVEVVPFVEIISGDKTFSAAADHRALTVIKNFFKIVYN